jgi:hypothetical protein
MLTMENVPRVKGEINRVICYMLLSTLLHELYKFFLHNLLNVLLTNSKAIPVTGRGGL